MVYALFNFTDSKVSFVLILIGAVVVSPISKRFFKSLDKTRQRIIRVTIPIITVLFGTVLSAISYSKKEIDIARSYLKAHPDLVFLKQIDTLRYYENYFSGAYENDSDEAYLQKLLTQKIQSSQFLRGEFEKETSNTQNVRVVFIPKISSNDTLSREYQNVFEDMYTKSYRIVFEFENEDIKSVKALIDNNVNQTEYDLYSLPQLSINQKKFNSQTEYIKARINLLKGYQIKEKFVKNCFDAFNGSHIGLVRLIKEKMHDPKSFEHVETNYKILGNRAIVNMKYRGNNKLGALVLNQIEAVIDIDSCKLLKTE